MAILSENISRIKPSATMAVTNKARELKAAGVDIIGLGAGEPDFDTPDNIKKAAIEAINNGDTKYTAVDGTPSLKKVIIQKFKNENNLDYSSDQISVGTGGKQIIFNALLASVDPGDEVIIPAPYWVSYPDIVAFAGGNTVSVECNESSNFKITAQQLSQNINDKTKWVILNSPSNPTGSCYTESELLEISKVIENNPHVNVMTDDIYEHLVYDDFTFKTIAEVNQNIIDQTLIINGVSKAYAMTGWRIGYSFGNIDIIKAMSKIQGQATSCANSIGQAASIEALIGSQEKVDSMIEVFKERRDYMVEILNNLPEVECRLPGGAFYAFPSFNNYIGKNYKNKTINDSFDLSEIFLNEAYVATIPGDGFGAPGYVRFSYAIDKKTIKDGLGRIEKIIKEIK